MVQKMSLGNFEELVLLALIQLGSEAYGVIIRQFIEERTGYSTSIGAVYTTLERLIEKGYVSSRQGEATRERGGRAKRYFEIEGAGRTALREADIVRSRLSYGVVW